MYKIGIDIGGTNADFVLVNAENKICAHHKILIQMNLEKIILDGINQFFTHDILPQQCLSINIGTTIGVNSLIELKSLQRVGLIRLAGHQPDLPPLYQCYPAQREAILAGVQTLPGGREFDNKAITNIDAAAIKKAVQQLLANGAESLAVISVFSPLYNDDEKQVRDIIHALAPDIPISLSCEIGGLGFIERENNTIINATLKHVMQKYFSHLKASLVKSGITCPIHVTQNNGTLISIDHAVQFPIKTLSSGPVNSLIGSCKMAGVSDAIVVDIGGTSTDIGIVENGFPRYSMSGAVIANIPTNFMLPDIQVLALGGGSKVKRTVAGYEIGPESIAADIFTKSLSFGGDCLTVFDAGNAINQFFTRENNLSPAEAHAILAVMVDKIKNTIHALPASLHLPVILTGGGAQNIPENYLDKRYIRPEYYQVANAYGAAQAEISGHCDTICSLSENREAILDELAHQAKQDAIANGAHPDKVRIIEKRLLPFYYMPNQLTRVIMTAAG
jgi:N-methylhydantoinase A/oxoprolinase/acetone carboxylase beta subunit